MNVSLFNIFRGAIKEYSWTVLLDKQFWKTAYEIMANKWGFCRIPVTELHGGYLKGEYTQEMILMMLYPEQVEEFVAHHAKEKVKWCDGVFDRQVASRFAQLENMIDRDLEASIVRKRGRVNVVKRIN